MSGADPFPTTTSTPPPVRTSAMPTSATGSRFASRTQGGRGRSSSTAGECGRTPAPAPGDVGQRFGTRFEFECYDIGHLYTLAHCADRKLVEPPFLIQGVFGILGGIGPDPRNLAHMVTIADSLFGNDYVFSAFAAGRHQMNFCLQSALLGGGGVRVGLEDSLYIGAGRLARSNAEQVRKIRLLLEEIGLEIATPDEARALLALKGPDQVGF